MIPEENWRLAAIERRLDKLEHTIENMNFGAVVKDIQYMREDQEEFRAEVRGEFKAFRRNFFAAVVSTLSGAVLIILSAGGHL